MTAGEAERFYEQVHAGEVDKVPSHVGGNSAPRKDLPQRQLEELELGAFADAPAFRKALLKLCARTDVNLLVRERKMGWVRLALRWTVGVSHLDTHAFEKQLVSLREKHKRPVWTNDQVTAAIAAAKGRREAAETFVQAMAQPAPIWLTRADAMAE